MRLALPTALLLAASAAPVLAAPCYVIYDRNDAVIYRDYQPPFDQSEVNSPERAQLRSRGQQLVVAEFDNCNPVGYISATTGGTAATVDEIVMQLKPAIGTAVTATTMAPLQTSPGRRPAEAPRVNPAAITVTTGGGGVSAR
ncbi:MAG: hypothetical protein IT522_11295 [Burkholderiales bacterium]|nr:hypothetical protein [Burkholderiales bacterium]